MTSILHVTSISLLALRMAQNGQRAPSSLLGHKEWFQKVQTTLLELRPHVKPEGAPILDRLEKEIQEFEEDLSQQLKPDVVDISEVEERDLPQGGGEGEWKYLGRGAFGTVFRVTFQGNPCAVKVFKAGLDSRIRESDILRGLSHDNIIAYRGTGQVTYTALQKRIGDNVSKLEEDEDDDEDDGGKSKENCEDLVYRFLIMEYLPKNLETFVEMSVSEKSEMTKRGLLDEQTCMIGEKIANALAYLHSKNIAHRDLKPDNVLYDPARRTVKLADFGLAWHEDVKLLDKKTGSTTSSTKHIRWAAPELILKPPGQQAVGRGGHERYKRGDVWSLGMILIYCITRRKPFPDFLESWEIDPSAHEQPSSRLHPELPPDLLPELRDVVEKCRDKEPARRPTASFVASTLLQLHGNFEVPEYEFFTCGFLKKTEIFVADSCVSEDSLGCLASGARGEGYRQHFLLCPVDTDPSRRFPIPPDWELSEKYYKAKNEMEDKAEKKIIDNNPAVALKKLTVARPGKEELQLLELRFQQSTYCHHRAMREMWMRELSDVDKRKEVPCLATVHPHYSTSFGLHLAVLTNEGPGKPKKFIFCRRAQRPGMSSPGTITCGAVESCSVNDFEGPENSKRVNLVRTAARGLHEELGVELKGRDLEAVTLQTVYMKYDTHEWGLCGYVDLADDRIDPARRISAEELISLFTTGPKDKFEHQQVIPVDFTLEKMVAFVFENQDTFASSAKLVVVKVLQTFYGVEPVQRAFQMFASS